jgi:hypothetical protein
MHFAVPAQQSGDEDSFIVLGTDRNAGDRHVITSRGYGAGQYTLFHHPPRPEDVTGVMLDPVKNVQRAARELREKFDRFVVGPDSRADDRIAEIGTSQARALRECRFAPGDPRRMRDCVTCVAAAGTRTVSPGLPVHAGASTRWAPVPELYSMPTFAMPARERLGCDWPYAVRRYNGGGLKSYHYQARVLRNLLTV